MKERYASATTILSLKKGKEHILLNAECVDPAYFLGGGKQARDILEELRQLGPLEKPPQDICSPALFQFFCLHSLVVKEESNTEPFRENRTCSCDKISSGRSLYLLVSHSCNQACIYCLDGKATYGKENEWLMSREVAMKSSETALKSLSAGGRLEIVFFGGEPLMNWNLCKETIHYCETVLKPEHPDKQIVYHLTTNLTLFPTDLIAYAKKYGMTFLIDIDGPEDLHNTTRPFRKGKGSYGTTVRNVKRLVDAGFEVCLRATVTSYNQKSMLEVTKIHKDIGASGSAFVPLNAINSDEDELPLKMCPSPTVYAKGLKEVYHSGLWDPKQLFPFNEYMGRMQRGYRNTFSCGAPFGNTPVVTADGRVYACIYLVGIPKYQIGNIFSDDFPREQVTASMLNTINVDNREDCKGCGFRYLCGGGCPVGQFLISGNPQASKAVKKYTKEIACATSKTVITELLWSMARNAKQEIRSEDTMALSQ